MESIRRMRKVLDMTLAQVAERTGLSISFLSDLERGRTDPSLSTLRKVASCYGVSVVSLLEEEKPVEQNLKVNQSQIGESTTAVFWHGSQTLTIFTAKTKLNLSKDETYKLLTFLQAEIREPLDIHNIEDPNTQTYLLAMNEQRSQEDRETQRFLDVERGA